MGQGARIAVVGGGIAGLAAAWELLPAVDQGAVALTLFEGAPRLGGAVRTDTAGGVVIEGGPDSFLTRKPDAETLCREVGLADHLIATRPENRGAYLFRRGRLYPLPEGMMSGIPTRIGPLLTTPVLSWSAKLRALGDLVLPRSAAARSPASDPLDVSLGGFLRRRLGSGVVDDLAEPILSGIYAASADDLSLLASFPDLLTMERRHRSLILALRQAARRTPRPGPPGASPFLTLDVGLQALVEALAARLHPIAIRLNTPVRSVTPTASGYRLETESGAETFDAVVVAAPAFAAARLLQPLDEPWVEDLAAIPYSNLAVVGLAYEPTAIPRPLDKTGFLVPRREGLTITAVTWLSAKWPHPRQRPWETLRVFLGRAGGPDVTQWDDGRLLDTVAHDLGRTMGIAQPPRYHVIFRLPQALPQYRVGHVARIRRVEAGVAAHPGLALAGAAYHGVGLPDCIRSGRQAARRVVQALTAGPAATFPRASQDVQ